MKKDKTRAPSPTPDREQLAFLRTKQEWHERLAQRHAASAKRLWLRRVLLELSQESQKGEARSKRKRKKAGVKKEGQSRVKKKSKAGMQKKGTARAKQKASRPGTRSEMIWETSSEAR